MEISLVGTKTQKCFKDIKEGECFYLGDLLYMKVESCGGINAVSLADGIMFTHPQNMLVEPKACKVINA